MSRETKFRVWCPKRKLFLIEGDLIKDFLAEEDAEFRTYIVESDLIWQQHTGLKDKNGKDIYEGDILMYLDGDFERGTDGGDDKMEVYYDEQYARFGLIFESKFGGEGYTGLQQHIHQFINEGACVIGNIFEKCSLQNS